eukprot:TRINITY_DN6606_c0_g1_i1.p1 TRINITY_DN6606_c0_g1~~TRINITY_DN6606_c0_g1_i1.p1  ORF type:complete len:426 (-),score=90.71 TRINITY_DN6606_c0_g1_i1:15-1292(-)
MGKSGYPKGCKTGLKVLYWRRATNNQDPMEDPYWETISEHKNDPSLDSEFASHTFTVKLPPGTSYRAFRIIQTGKNKYAPPKSQKDDWSDVLVVSGFEIYGYLNEVNPPSDEDKDSSWEPEIDEDGRKRFTYHSESERKGILQYLGGYPNIQVFASSLYPGKFLENFISNEEVYVWTKNEKFSWFAVDLGKGRTAEVTEYTLRYGSGGNYCCPRNWLLQGTNSIEVLMEDQDPTEDPKWETLRVHINDETLDSDWAIHTWKLNIPENQSYRIFRIIQTGKNKYQVEKGLKDSWSDVLVASGFELYGTLYEKPKRKKQVKERLFEYKHDLDRNGVIFGLGGSPVVKVHASSLYTGKNLVNFISKDMNHHWTQNEKFAWFAVDLGKDRSCRPTHYSLRYGSGGNLCCPRNWLLQATNDVDALNTPKR